MSHQRNFLSHQRKNLSHQRKRCSKNAKMVQNRKTQRIMRLGI